MLSTTIRVSVAGSVKEYAQDIAGFGTFLADGGKIVSLDVARAQARAFFKANADATWTAVTFWATLDESGLAYRLDFNRHGSWSIKAAAPLPGLNNVQEIYVA